MKEIDSIVPVASPLDDRPAGSAVATRRTSSARQPASGRSGPRPILRLLSARFQKTFGHGAYGLNEPRAAAELYFDYPGAGRLSAGMHPVAVTRIPAARGLQIVQRNVDFESATLRCLQALGLDFACRYNDRAVRLDSTEPCLLSTTATPAEFWFDLLLNRRAALEAEGFLIEIEEDFPYQPLAPDDWYVSASHEKGHTDWFNLDMGVRLDGERVSLVEALARWLKQPDAMADLAKLPEDHFVPLPLPDGRILPITAGRLRAWIAPLVEFMAVSGTTVRVPRTCAAQLAAMEGQGVRLCGSTDLRALGRKLKQCTALPDCPPAPGFQAVLRPYQQEGLNWLQFLREYNLAGILADDMGLGKTVQALAHIHLEKHCGRARHPSLVIAPTSLMPNWQREARKFAPDLKVLTLHGPDRADRFARIGEADLILTTYPLLVRDQAVLLRQQYHVLILDEAQFIKNAKAQAHKVAGQLKARHRLSLTGTPLENHLGELWAQFDFLMPGLLGSASQFGQQFRQPIEKQQCSQTQQTLAERVRPFLLRRTKESVLKELPGKTEIVRFVELQGDQLDLYEALRVSYEKKLRDAIARSGVAQNQVAILDALLKLRQACCDPRLVKLKAAARINESAKLDLLRNMVAELVEGGRRILIFSQFTSMLALIEAELKALHIRYVKLTGATRDRHTPVDRFQRGEAPVFLLSLKAAGTGLNLTAADTVIHYDPWWNPAVEAQASARAYRIGQDKPVFVYKLLTQGTVEEMIQLMQDRKRSLADGLYSAGGDGHLINSDDLEILFQPVR